MMLLKHIDFRPLPDWLSSCRELNIKQEPNVRGYQENDPEIGLYPEELFRYVITHNFHFRMHFFDNEWESALLNAPIMVLLDGVLDKFPRCTLGGFT